MVAFDTNYLVRHLVQDDFRQTKTVRKVLDKELAEGRTILIFDIVLCETVWVLKSVYQAKKSEILNALNGIVEESCFEFENLEQLKLAISRFEKSQADFSDCLIAEKSQATGRELLTFDKKLLKEL